MTCSWEHWLLPKAIAYPFIKIEVEEDAYSKHNFDPYCDKEYCQHAHVYLSTRFANRDKQLAFILSKFQVLLCMGIFWNVYIPAKKTKDFTISWSHLKSSSFCYYKLKRATTGSVIWHLQWYPTMIALLILRTQTQYFATNALIVFSILSLVHKDSHLSPPKSVYAKK